MFLKISSMVAGFASAAMGGFDVAESKELLNVGMEVRAVWKDPADCVGTLNDIEYFEPVTVQGR